MSMHGIDLTLVVHFYIDTSGFGANLAITQFQHPTEVETSGKALVKVPIIYDSFTFAPTRRKYPTYKRELYALVEFVTLEKEITAGSECRDILAKILRFLQ